MIEIRSLIVRLHGSDQQFNFEAVDVSRGLTCLSN